MVTIIPEVIFLMGIIFSIIAGIAMSLQGVFNTRVESRIGTWETNAIVQGSAFVITIILALTIGKGSFKNIKDVSKIYLLGGVLGVIIIFTVIEGIKNLGATYSIATILIAQLTAAALIDALGLFECKKISFGLNEILGVMIMIAGIIIFKWKR
jgi:transporter family-2 protein